MSSFSALKHSVNDGYELHRGTVYNILCLDTSFMAVTCLFVILCYNCLLNLADLAIRTVLP